MVVLARGTRRPPPSPSTSASAPTGWRGPACVRPSNPGRAAAVGASKRRRLRGRLGLPDPQVRTTPAASTPRTRGGARPTSQLPPRTTWSQLPTPALRTSGTTSSAVGDGGSATFTSSMGLPKLEMPAARMLDCRAFVPTSALHAAVGAETFGSRARRSRLTR